jgi:hypothetical protein
MNVASAVRLIKKHRPKSIEDFTKAGLILERKPVGVGIFREVVKVKDLPLVIKFPLSEGTHDPKKGKKLSYRAGKMHSTVEVRKIGELSKLRWMRRHLPTIYYHDKKSGVLVMHWYKEFDDDGDAFRALGRLATKIIQKWIGVGVSDIHKDNVRMGRSKKEVIIVDLGY